MYLVCMIKNRRVNACVATMDAMDATLKFENMLHNYMPPEEVRDVMNEYNPEMYGPQIIYEDEIRHMTYQIKKI